MKRRGPDGKEGDMTERRGTRWNGEGPDGMEDLMEWKGTRWNGGTQDMERRMTRRSGEGSEGTESDQIERTGIRRNGQT